MVIAAQGVAGIFLVHVAETHRRRGIGRALTMAALRAGRDRGRRLAALTASVAGEPLYRRFGFTAVSEYRLFTLPAFWGHVRERRAVPPHRHGDTCAHRSRVLVATGTLRGLPGTS